MASRRTSFINILALTSALFFITNINFLLPFTTETKIFLGYPKDSLLNFTQLAQKYGYPSEEHTAVTKDGYVLKMFRISKGKNCKQKNSTPVLLMHGLLQGSDSWMDVGPNASLAFLIPDECHDLWVGNSRGNYYSRAHINLDPDKDPEYWKFSTDEMGLYDLPAMIDYILHHTGSDKLNYVGYSQGGTTFFIMCSELPDYCTKVRVMIGLSPASRMTNTRPAARMWAQTFMKMEGVLNLLGIHEIHSKNYVAHELIAFLTQLSAIAGKTLHNIFEPYHPGSISDETYKAAFGHIPMGTSVRTIARFGQSMDSEHFQKYDFGREENLHHYGSADPPKYNLSVATVPIVILYGENDYLNHHSDVKWLIHKLPNVIEGLAVQDPLWNHFDICYSQYTRELLFPKIKEYLFKYR